MMNRKNFVFIFVLLFILFATMLLSSPLKTRRGNIIAIIDTEFSTKVIKKSQVWKNKNEIPNNHIDDDNNGYIDDYYGWNFCKEKPPLWSSNNVISHGDIVANTFWQELNGSNCDISVMYLTAMSMDNTGTENDIIEAVKYAEDNGATICILSSVSFKTSTKLEDTIAHSNMEFVVPAGNYGMKLDSDFKCYPASYNYENVLAVGALDNDGRILDSSNYGSEYIDIFYNGIATYENQRYEGTSIACARVAALVASQKERL